MREIDIRKTQFTVNDFLSWQRQGALNINPAFQRRSVWKPNAKSYFVDTVVRGLPAPIIYLRQRIDLTSQRTVRDVVDGQQRLRTLFTYIDDRIVPDFNSTRDAFEIKPTHNKELAGKQFKKLLAPLQNRILEYEFSTHVLPADVEDREVLEMFARLNSTGVKLNDQELRNAEFFGELKGAMYDLALEQLERWRQWKIFTDDQIARMLEVELTSDLVMNMLQGLTGKSQARITSFYRKYEDAFPRRSHVQRRFRIVMDAIDTLLGPDIRKTIYKSQVFFFTLFVFVYDEMYGLGSKMKKTRPSRLSATLTRRLLLVSKRFEKQDVPENVLDAVRRASSDYGRRKTRLQYMAKLCHAATD